MIEKILAEQTLLEIKKIEINFTPVLFITKSMETWQGEN